MESPSDASFSDMVFNFVAYISGRIKTNGNNIPLWANMTSGSDSGTQWNRFIPYLD